MENPINALREMHPLSIHDAAKVTIYNGKPILTDVQLFDAASVHNQFSRSANLTGRVAFPPNE